MTKRETVFMSNKSLQLREELYSFLFSFLINRSKFLHFAIHKWDNHLDRVGDATKSKYHFMDFSDLLRFVHFHLFLICYFVVGRFIFSENRGVFPLGVHVRPKMPVPIVWHKSICGIRTGRSFGALLQHFFHCIMHLCCRPDSVIIC